MAFALHETHSPFKLGDIVVLDKTISIIKGRGGEKNIVQSAYLNGMEDLEEMPRHRTFLVVQEKCTLDSSIRTDERGDIFLHQLEGVAVVPYDISTESSGSTIKLDDCHSLKSLTRNGLAADRNFSPKILENAFWLRPDQTRAIGHCMFNSTITRDAGGEISTRTNWGTLNPIIKLTAEIGADGKFIPATEINSNGGAKLAVGNELKK